MTRDYSRFLPSATKAGTSKPERSTLERLGWQPFFAQQLSLEDFNEFPPVRVIEVHRNGLHVLGDDVDILVPPNLEATVGDWLLLDRQRPSHSRVLDRKSLFKRRAPGKERKLQLIAANVDTVFITSSCNHDFNVARLERYVAMAFEADTMPVIVLTKADLSEDPSSFVTAANAISDRVPVVLLNALSEEPAQRLEPWCQPGQTVAFMGSSGVGKSTLVNALFGTEDIKTGGIREDDSKGRHTTTRRQLHFNSDGCGFLDTPGMREIQLTDVEAGVADVFEDLTALADQCRFNDCQHDSEPGCAINAGIRDGSIDPARLARWRKLVAEERFNSSTLAERKAKDKSLQKLIRAVQKENKKRR
ncbi:ribosome small subunit-dependent GTPase A [Roseibium sp. SCPC15]|uniref:ribosome small subunit-dependent GTPase A n=1 Tax=Roseibium sp. SCP15 TaxID=3141376 RepID=UPI00333A243A